MHRSVSELITTRRPRVALSSLIAIALFIILGAQTNANAAGQSPAGSTIGQSGSSQTTQDKLDSELTARVKSGHPLRTTGVILTLAPGAALPPEFQKFAHPGKLDIINGHVLDLPDSLLTQVAAHPNVFKLHYDRPVATHNYRTAMTVGARKVNQTLGYTGAGIGVAVLDTGITSWHDDLTNTSSTTYPYGNQRVAKFVDFVNGQSLPYDDNGHGSHVSGTILGNGYDSNGEKAGMAPGASLVSLKVLDANGQGRISTVIKALDWVATHHKTYNIRVVNVSVGAGVFESYLTDPLTLATKSLVDKGITVVAAAGNFGENAQGQPQWGGITAPGNAPWVLTVCASSTMGTITRADDQLAPYSSAGPTAFDFLAKPDLCAPGSGTVSLAVPGSTFYETKSAYLADGSVSLGYKPYLSLTGTSMAAPVVSGTVALMLQANPSLTPNLIKAILQYTAQVYPGYSPLREGAGFLDSWGAVQLARFYARNKVGEPMPIESTWSQRIIWGNYLMSGGYLNPRGSAWANNIVWGTTSRDNIVWGTSGRNN
ncbi:MAG TPA: S8 family peptidase, partial [Vicinamibacterales bacterium]|nr:S8 family peptidase [Vicinamibacterales bacterium]